MSLYDTAVQILLGLAVVGCALIVGIWIDQAETQRIRDEETERRRRNLRAATPGHIEGHWPRARPTADGLRWEPWCSCNGRCVTGPKHGYDHRAAAISDAARQLEKRRNAA